MIPAHLSQVWHLIKLGSFDRWLSTLKSSEEAKGTSPDTDVVKWTFKDGTVQEIKQEEHSVCLLVATLSVRRRISGTAH